MLCNLSNFTARYYRFVILGIDHGLVLNQQSIYDLSFYNVTAPISIIVFAPVLVYRNFY